MFFFGKNTKQLQKKITALPSGKWRPPSSLSAHFFHCSLPGDRGRDTASLCPSAPLSFLLYWSAPPLRKEASSWLSSSFQKKTSPWRECELMGQWRKSQSYCHLHPIPSLRVLARNCVMSVLLVFLLCGGCWWWKLLVTEYLVCS